MDPLEIQLHQAARARLNRIAADMGRTPAELAEAVLEQWTLTVMHLAKRNSRPSGPNNPDFTHSGVLVPPQED
jgi:hypothetical protein